MPKKIKKHILADELSESLQNAVNFVYELGTFKQYYNEEGDKTTGLIYQEHVQKTLEDKTLWERTKEIMQKLLEYMQENEIEFIMI